jgi:sulfoxide reductase heme-binding subunit YedZ
VNKRASDLWMKVPVWLLGLGPLGWGVWAFFADRLGANPVETLLLVPGRWALVFLLLGLSVSPLRRFAGWSRLIRVRRLLGLFAFFYAGLHFLIYLGLDQGFAWSFIKEDITERPFITVGFTALVLLVPLAVTSTRGWIRRLGRRWQLLHRLVYPAAVLAALHFYWKVKADTFWPLVAAGILAVLLLARVPGWTRGTAGVRENSAGKQARRPTRSLPQEKLAEGR